MEKTNVTSGYKFVSDQYPGNGVFLNTDNNGNSEIVFIDKTALEDAIKFQQIEFDIIDDYYFNEGHNDKINNVIRHIYLKRKELKASKNPAQLVFKELMNSMYGKNNIKTN